MGEGDTGCILETRPCRSAGQNCHILTAVTGVEGLKEIGNMIVDKLRNYFGKRDDIVMAFLFGSWAKAHDGAESDIDVAVYFGLRDIGCLWRKEDMELLPEDRARLI